MIHIINQNSPHSKVPYLFILINYLRNINTRIFLIYLDNYLLDDVSNKVQNYNHYLLVYTIKWIPINENYIYFRYFPNFGEKMKKILSQIDYFSKSKNIQLRQGYIFDFLYKDQQGHFWFGMNYHICFEDIIHLAISKLFCSAGYWELIHPSYIKKLIF